MTLTSAYVTKGTLGAHRNENEYYPTPAIATLTLLKNHHIPETVWEPAAGRGHISRELQRNGHTVYSSDLFVYNEPYVEVEGGKDFLTCELPDAEALVTNPPFKSNLPEKLLRRVLPLKKYQVVALFCRLTFMESARRFNLFKDHPPAKILAFAERINCNEKYFDQNDGLGGMVAYAWFIWDQTWDDRNGTMLDWVKPSLYTDLLEKE